MGRQGPKRTQVSGDIDDFRVLLAKVGNGQTLGIDEAERAFDIMTSGNATPAQMGAFLMGLKVRGETAEELAGGSRALRAKVRAVKAPPGAIDIVGTGGDHHGTYNISSCSAFVVAGAGVPVAKHGNRAFTSKSGAADVLAALGIGLEMPIEKLERALVEANICFLMAPWHHSAMRNVAGPRVELAPNRTIFNLLGPMSSPALVKRQLVGVFDRRWLKPVAQALGQLGLERALVVHGQDGMDELTTTTASWAASLEDGQVRELEIRSEEIGLPRASIADLKGADAAHNARAIEDVLSGKQSAFRDIVVLNSAAALMVAGKARDLKEGAALAVQSIDAGKAAHALATLRRICA
ncbi:MAG: anthranilate phosphoribosyltransferase [Alphaproteobacteria bacterium]|nr:anthranilate phosphoribosyltransferase [Alphaproteobacteria bacterium]